MLILSRLKVVGVILMDISLKPHQVDEEKKKYHIEAASLEDKITLFEDYIHEFGEEITGKTVYKGFPIGRMLINIRSLITRGALKCDERSLERLNRYHLLDKKIDTIEEKIARLQKYCITNPFIWKNRIKILKEYEENSIYIPSLRDKYMKNYFKELGETPTILFKPLEEDGSSAIEIAMDELKKTLSDYEYIRIRKSKGKLDEKYWEQLKNAGVGGVFGEKEENLKLTTKEQQEIETLIAKTGIDKATLEQIIREFGSIDKFRELYISIMLDNKYWNSVRGETLKNLFGSLEKSKTFYEILKKLSNDHKIVTCFDIAKPNFILDGETSKLLYFASENEYAIGLFCNSSYLKKQEKNYLDNEEKILRDACETNGTKSLSKQAEEMHISRERVRQIKQKVFKKVREAMFKNINLYCISVEERRNFIKHFFDKYDIFIPNDPLELTEETRREFFSILGFEVSEIKDINDLSEIMVHKKYNISDKILISDLALPHKYVVALNQAKLYTVQDIIEIVESPNDLTRIYGIGQEGYQIIVKSLHDIGVKFDYEKTLELSGKKQLVIEELDIFNVDFSTRTINALTKYGYSNLIEIILDAENIEYLEDIPALGNKSIKELVHKVHELGFKFRWEENSDVDIDTLLENKIEALRLAYQELEKQQAEYQEIKDKIASKPRSIGEQKAEEKDYE